MAILAMAAPAKEPYPDNAPAVQEGMASLFCKVWRDSNWRMDRAIKS